MELDVRTLYLKDLTLLGCTVLDPRTFPSLIRHIESGALTPAVAEVYPLARLDDAQEAFGQKAHTGKIVIEVAPVQ